MPTPGTTLCTSRSKDSFTMLRIQDLWSLEFWQMKACLAALLVSRRRNLLDTDPVETQQWLQLKQPQVLCSNSISRVLSITVALEFRSGRFVWNMDGWGYMHSLTSCHSYDCTGSWWGIYSSFEMDKGEGMKEECRIVIFWSISFVLKFLKWLF
jgi:hypothetical protein